MSTLADVLVDAFRRVHEVVHEVIKGLDGEELSWRADHDANSIAWLIWHLARVEDDHIAQAGDLKQVWMAGWSDRFGLPFSEEAIGYGHSSAEVAAVRIESGDLLTGYYDAVHDQTINFVSGLTEADLDRIVDRRWDPPVTLGVRLVSVISDCLQHAGQAALLRGIAERR